MKFKDFIIQFIITFVVAFIASAIVIFLYNLIIHGTGRFMWSISFMLSFTVGFVIPFSTLYTSKKK
ncbi:MAG: hypothetical protein RAP70_00235 [Candidatus Celaenobacter antarcticus]|nr:hypothetical protein [Candidatus Celaenobacter antarcticus]